MSPTILVLVLVVVLGTSTVALLAVNSLITKNEMKEIKEKRKERVLLRRTARKMQQGPIE